MMPIPWSQIWKYKILIPLVLADAFVIFSAGAASGANVVKMELTDVVRVHNNIVKLEHSDFLLEEYPWLSQFGAELVAIPMEWLGSFFIEGFWYGMANPEVSQHLPTVAIGVFLVVIGGYAYGAYKSVREVTSWL